MSDPTPMAFADVFEQLHAGGELSAARTTALFDSILSGGWTPVQIAGLLVALRMRGETPAVVAAAARAMRAKMVRVGPVASPLMDTCGTGGDGKNTINISTAASLVVAAAGVAVAKHGNRAASSTSGTADVLEELGIDVELPPAAQTGVLERAGICFLFARAHHPAMRYAGPVRAELKIRTIFNMLGPLCNPAGATHQLVGTFSHSARELMAGALAELGTERAWVVHSDDGYDELSPFGETRVSVVEGGAVTSRVTSPEEFGLAPSAPGAIDGGSAADNADTLRALLDGQRHPARPAVVLNAAASLVVAKGMAPMQAAGLASQLLDDGSAKQVLQRWRAACEAARAGKA